MANIDKYKEDLINAVNSLNIKEIENLAVRIKKLVKTNKALFVIGNGGSSATASHMVCDLQKTVLGKSPSTYKGARLKAVCLADNVPLVTAWSNDDSYDLIFSEQLKNMGTRGDLLIVITGSGNSKNILEALKTASKLKIDTFGFLGFDGGKALKLTDKYILVSSEHYGIVEDVHMILDHILTEVLKDMF